MKLARRFHMCVFGNSPEARQAWTEAVAVGLEEKEGRKSLAQGHQQCLSCQVRRRGGGAGMVTPGRQVLDWNSFQHPTTAV